MSIMGKIGSGIKYCVSRVVGLGTVMMGGAVIGVPTVVGAATMTLATAAGTKLSNTVCEEQQDVYENSTYVGVGTLNKGLNFFHYCRPTLFSGGVYAGEKASELAYGISSKAYEMSSRASSNVYSRFKRI